MTNDNILLAKTHLPVQYMKKKKPM